MTCADLALQESYFLAKIVPLSLLSVSRCRNSFAAPSPRWPRSVWKLIDVGAHRVVVR